MTPKERMVTALGRGCPDRLPITIHQWQDFHLREFMGGVDQLEAFLATGLDASVTPWNLTEEVPSERWRRGSETLSPGNFRTRRRDWIATPAGTLSWEVAGNEFTTFLTEHPLKTREEAENLVEHLPEMRLDRTALGAAYDRTGDHGIVRGFVCCLFQPGPWQDFCELAGTERAILWALDEPEFVHGILERLTRWKVAYVEREMGGARYDLIEHGGGAASSTVISPAMFDEFCVPYDRRIIAALHAQGFRVVYHTCGGMKAILDHIPANGCDASETLSPPGVGGDLGPGDRRLAKAVLGSKVALIGGIDQGRLLTEGMATEIAAEVRACFETYGAGGGYVCSASDHFFHTPVENLRAMAAAARDCRY